MRVGVEVEHAAGAEGSPKRARGGSPAPGPAARAAAATKPSRRCRPGEELLEGNRVEPAARRVEPRQELPGDRLLRPLPPPEAAPPALPRLAPREQQLHQHPLRQHDLLAPRVEAQRRDLDDGALRLALEDARQQPREIQRHVLGRTTPEAPDGRARTVPSRETCISGLAERGRHEAREAHLIREPAPRRAGRAVRRPRPRARGGRAAPGPAGPAGSRSRARRRAPCPMARAARRSRPS